MGRGDKRSAKGKRARGSYGKTRRPSNRKQKEQLVPVAKSEPAAEQPQGAGEGD